jgi:hypothetical protein
VEVRQRCGGSGEKGEESENKRWDEFVGVLREKEEIEIGREINNDERMKREGEREEGI